MNDRLFSPLSLGSLELPNRITFPAHATKLVQNGVITDEVIAYYEERARGGVGMIVLEFTVVHDDDAMNPLILAGHRPAVVPTYRRLMERLRPYGTKVLVQLSHRGTQRLTGAPRPVSRGPSPVPTQRYYSEPRELGAEQIESILAGFEIAARHAAEGGLDGIEVTAAHTLLIDEFLSPQLNTRVDEWAAGPAFLEAVLDRVRRGAPGLTLGVRFSAETEHARVGARAIADDVDFLSITLGDSASLRGGTLVIAPTPLPTNLIAEYADGFKVGPPLIATSRIVDAQGAESILGSGTADAVGMVRALIVDPLLPAKLRGEVDRPIVRCIACNNCSGGPVGGPGLRCAPNPRVSRELTFPLPEPDAESLHVAVVGGGPAGLAAAADALARGHRVTLFERRAELGGQMALAAASLTQAETGRTLVENYAAQLAAGADVRIGAEADLETLTRLAPDAVVLAAGAEPYRPPELAALPGALHAWDVLARGAPRVESAVVLDWSGETSGAAAAELLAAAGAKVTLAVSAASFQELLGWFLRDIYLERLYRAGIEIVPHVDFDSWADGEAKLRNVFAPEVTRTVSAGALVYSRGRTPRTADAALEAGPWAFASAGDCLSPRTLEEAILEGTLAARSVTEAAGRRPAGAAA